MDMDHLMKMCEKTTERYIEAEEFIMNLKWYQRIFMLRKWNKFMQSRKNINFK